MTTQLRPLSLGEILDRTAELYRNNFLLFAGISAIFATVMLLAQMLDLGVLRLIGYPNVPGNQQWAVATLSVLQTAVWLLAAGLAIAAINRAVAWVHMGEPASIRASVASVRPRMGRYLWLMTNVSLRAWGPLAAVYIVVFAILFAVMPAGWLTNPGVMQQPHVQNSKQILEAGVAILALGPVFFLAVIYGAFMWLRYSLAMPACVVEGLSARDSIKRSIELSKGSRGRIFVLWLLVYAIRVLLGLLLGFPLIFFTIKHVGKPLPLGLMAITQVAGFLVNTFIGPIYSAGLTLFYYDQRVRKEGFDIVWMMQAAGLSPHAELSQPVEQENQLPQI
jgi:membrane-anchored glycerophosphoryl diester phosphodiesterase (GDPDase)